MEDIVTFQMFLFILIECFITCENRICDKDSGSCISCNDRYWGPNCDRGKIWQFNLVRITV